MTDNYVEVLTNPQAFRAVYTPEEQDAIKNGVKAAYKDVQNSSAVIDIDPKTNGVLAILNPDDEARERKAIIDKLKKDEIRSGNLKSEVEHNYATEEEKARRYSRESQRATEALQKLEAEKKKGEERNKTIKQMGMEAGAKDAVFLWEGGAEKLVRYVDEIANNNTKKGFFKKDERIAQGKERALEIIGEMRVRSYSPDLNVDKATGVDKVLIREINSDQNIPENGREKEYRHRRNELGNMFGMLSNALHSAKGDWVSPPTDVSANYRHEDLSSWMNGYKKGFKDQRVNSYNPDKTYPWYIPKATIQKDESGI